ncbi:hypothetical protein ER21_08300 [Cronobacter sakazakii]|nr:hypothetical protein ER21_08300 [Cronobacter sakazakii]
MTDADGQTVWRGQFSTWGDTERELSVPQWQVPQNLRFQGQYLDRESGLHYNLFRYYDPVAGRYTQMDPIGLAGGMNTYSYVGDPLVWVDPLGLMCETTSKKWIQAFEREHGDAGIHGLRRHGAGTTLEQQKYRATTGYTPDAVPGRPVDATRFLTYQDHQQAIERALKEYDPKIHTNGKVDFDMPQTVAEGYKMGGEEYFSTRRVRVIFNTKTGKMYSIFGIVE